MRNFLTKLFSLLHLTDSREDGNIPQTREVSPTPIREVTDSLTCPYCHSNNVQKRGFRQKKRERVQLYLCLGCRKTFTPTITKGKHYPLSVMLDAISIYNLGYSLEQTCRIIQVRSQKVKVKSASQNSKLNTGGSEFPCVTEQASFVSEASGGKPTDSSATPASNYQSNTKSANVSTVQNVRPGIYYELSD